MNNFYWKSRKKNATVLFIVKEVNKTVKNVSEVTVQVLCFYFVLIWY